MESTIEMRGRTDYYAQKWLAIQDKREHTRIQDDRVTNREGI